MPSVPFTQSRTHAAMNVWPLDDTEESILGISLHQATIVHVRIGVVGAARREQIPVAIALEGLMATVYTRDGRRMHREGDIEEELARQGTELGRRDVELHHERERRETELQQERERRGRTEAEVARLKRLLAERSGE